MKLIPFSNDIINSTTFYVSDCIIKVIGHDVKCCSTLCLHFRLISYLRFVSKLHDLKITLGWCIFWSAFVCLLWSCIYSSSTNFLLHRQFHSYLQSYSYLHDYLWRSRKEGSIRYIFIVIYITGITFLAEDYISLFINNYIFLKEGSYPAECLDLSVRNFDAHPDKLSNTWKTLFLQ